MQRRALTVDRELPLWNRYAGVAVNGVPATSLRVNHAFRGVVIPRSGVWRIEYRYRPRYLTATLWAAGCAVILMIFWMVRARAWALEAGSR